MESSLNFLFIRFLQSFSCSLLFVDSSLIILFIRFLSDCVYGFYFVFNLFIHLFFGVLSYSGFSRDPRFLGQICDGGQTTFESPKQTLYLTFRSRAKHAVRSRGFRLRVRTEPSKLLSKSLVWYFA